MKYLRIFLVIIWKIWYYIVAAFCTIFIGGTIYILTYQKNDRLTYFFMRLWAIVLFYGSGFTYTFRASEKLDKNQNYLFASNHTSMIDIALMYILHPNHPIVFVGKKELEQYPIFGRIYSKVSILVDRSDTKSRQTVYSLVKEKLKKNKNIVIFPEGGVPDRDVILGKFKEGLFTFSAACNVPIAVYAFHNLKNMFPFVFTLGYPGRIKVERLAILHPEGETKDTLRDKTYKMLFNELKDDNIDYPEIK